MARAIQSVAQLNQDANAFYDALNSESSLACILLASSYLDQCVGSLLQKFLIDGGTSEKLLDPRGGILGSFANRANLAYSLGLIGKWSLQNLQCILEIRNVLAHNYSQTTFDTKEVV